MPALDDRSGDSAILGAESDIISWWRMALIAALQVLATGIALGNLRLPASTAVVIKNQRERNYYKSSLRIVPAIWKIGWDRVEICVFTVVSGGIVTGKGVFL
jgi:hypothetical protein